MKQILSNEELDKLVKKAEKIATGDYRSHIDTATNHAALQSLHVKTDAELIKTIHQLDEKNGKLQKLLFWLFVIATVATIVALLKIVQFTGPIRSKL